MAKEVDLDTLVSLFISAVRRNNWPVLMYVNRQNEYAEHQMRAPNGEDLSSFKTITVEEFRKGYLQLMLNREGGVYVRFRRWKRDGRENDRWMSVTPDQIVGAKMYRETYIVA